jgi:hypothetical protein
MTNVDLEKVRDQVELLRWTKVRQAELKELEAAARDDVENIMGNADTGTLDGKPVIKWSTYKKRQLNQKMMREEIAEIAEAYTELIDVRRFELVDDES